MSVLSDRFPLLYPPAEPPAKNAQCVEHFSARGCDQPKVWVLSSHTGWGENFEVAGVFATADAAKRAEPSESNWFEWSGAWHNHRQGEEPVDTGQGRAYITITEYEVES